MSIFAHVQLNVLSDTEYISVLVKNYAALFRHAMNDLWDGSITPFVLYGCQGKLLPDVKRLYYVLCLLFSAIF